MKLGVLVLLLLAGSLIACTSANNRATPTATTIATSAAVSATTQPAAEPTRPTSAPTANTATPRATASANVAVTPAASAAAVVLTQPPGDPQTWHFAPATVTVKAGAKVTWTNPAGNEIHTVTADDGATFDSGVLSAGDTFTQVFPTAGTFTYHCTLHTWMKGAVTVLP